MNKRIRKKKAKRFARVIPEFMDAYFQWSDGIDKAVERVAFMFGRTGKQKYVAEILYPERTR
jgi:hypothetical protein